MQDSDSSSEGDNYYHTVRGRMGLNQGRHNLHQENMEYKMKIDLPSFDSRMDMEEFLD